MDDGNTQRMIRGFEHKAFYSVLRVFHAQCGDSFPWEKASVLMELMEELRMSNNDHKLHLDSIRRDDTVQQIRVWNQRVSCETSDLRPSRPGSASAKLFQYPPSLNPSENKQIAAMALIGRKIWIKWPEDEKFYEAYLARHHNGLHELVYDKGTGHETYEWVNLQEIHPEDIRWGGNNPKRQSQKASRKITFRCSQGKARTERGMADARVQMAAQPLQDGIGTDEITLLKTDSLVQKVEAVFSANPVDQCEAEKAKMILREHEAALINAIAKIEAKLSEETSDG